MPGSISDSYDPEWGTAANADLIRKSIQNVRELVLSDLAGSRMVPKAIDDVCRGPNGTDFELHYFERQLRIILFALDRAFESI
jgi:hypothetical protein